jgi:hypothetical protein
LYVMLNLIKNVVFNFVEKCHGRAALLRSMGRASA